jgi:hypothetical protein
VTVRLAGLTFGAQMALDLLDLYKSVSVNQMTELDAAIERLDIDEIANAYRQLQQDAPRRHSRRKKYFVDGHEGVTSAKGKSNRIEEHLAGALWHAYQGSQSLSMPDGSTLNLVDYHVRRRIESFVKGQSEQ